MNLLFHISLVCFATGFNLEFNSEQFPSWIKIPLTYSSFVIKKSDYDSNHKETPSSCVFLLPKHFFYENLNESSPHIFESKCYANQCASDSKDSRSILSDDIMCSQINGTIDKVTLFSIAEYNFDAREISYVVYIIIEGCFILESYRLNYISWILTNDTSVNHRILQQYEMNLPLNDNKSYFGEMTFDEGDKDCSNLCVPTSCDKSIDLKIERSYDHPENSTTIAPYSPDTEKPPTVLLVDDKTNTINKFLKPEQKRVNEASTGMFMYVGIVVVVILIIAFLSYLVYHTLY